MVQTFIHLNQLVTLKDAHQKDGRKLNPDDLSIFEDGAIVYADNEIIWVGPSADLPSEFQKNAINLSGHVLTPEVIDSHTHIVFGGDRAQEYADRLNGVAYEEIAKRGGGILYTMNETNKASAEVLFQEASQRIERLHSYGIGTIEIKSGYGLNYQKEKEISFVIDRLKKKFHPKIKIFNTYLAAHDVPKGFNTSSQYIQEVVLPLLEDLSSSNIIDAIDIFHEKNYFSRSDVEALFKKGQDLGIPCKSHADELNDNDGASLAVKYRALSADHLLRVSDQGIMDLAKSATVATLLPGTAFFLGKPLAPARALLDAGAKVSLASDYNPGSCHCDNLLLIASLSAPQLKLNQAELWAGITLNAAAALGLTNQGALIPGMVPRFSLFKVESLAHITYSWGRNFSVNLP